jgi:hypothetical protein
MQTITKIIILNIFIIQFSFGQNSPIWRTSIELQKRLSKSISLETKLETRFYVPEYQNSLAFNYFRLFEIGANYDFNKRFSTSVFYRYSHRKNNEFANFESRSRYFVNLSYKSKFKNIKINNRLRYQQQYKDNDEINELQSNFIRYKLEGTYKLTKEMSPYVATEFFYKTQDKSIDQLRISTGLNYKLNKKNGFDLGIFKDFNNLNNGLLNIEIGYKFEF